MGVEGREVESRSVIRKEVRLMYDMTELILFVAGIV